MRYMKEDRKYIDRMNLCMNQIDGLYYMAARKLGIKDNTLALFYSRIGRRTASRTV